MNRDTLAEPVEGASRSSAVFIDPDTATDATEQRGVGNAGSGSRDPYRGVILLLIGVSLLGAGATFAGYLRFANPILLTLCLTLGIAASVLVSVAIAQAARLREAKAATPPATATISEATVSESADIPPQAEVKTNGSRLPVAVGRALSTAKQQVSELNVSVAAVSAIAGLIVVAFLLLKRIPDARPTPLLSEIAIGLCLLGAALAGVIARYLSEVEPARFPEAVGLCRAARVTAWMFVVAAAALAFSQWTPLRLVVQILYLLLLAIDAAFCLELIRTMWSKKAVRTAFPLDFALLSVLGNRTNILASVLDAAERQLGIDLRSTWALTLLRRSLEPLALGLCLAAWLSTCLTVVAMDEQGMLERFGVPSSGPPLGPGLHLHLPWPLDRVYRIPVQRVQTVQVGHEGQESGGPENVLWSVEHAPNEFTLLLGNGRDLITVDAAVQYRIVDTHAWLYHCQNPAAALKAIAYRAVMRSTINLTLSDALSQNVSILADKMRGMVQKEADDLGLGVQILAFTVSGMHPPVPVASAYEAVISAQLGKVTATVNAQAFRNQTVPSAESSVLSDENTARADGADSLALAAGQAWSFRTLESQYRAAPSEFFFRRRLETLEKILSARPYTVVDSRFLRDGGEIWSTR